jgi:hypothetical protein
MDRLKQLEISEPKRKLPLLQIKTTKDPGKTKNNFLMSPGALLRSESKMGMSLLEVGIQEKNRHQIKEVGMQLMSLKQMFVTLKSDGKVKAVKKKSNNDD